MNDRDRLARAITQALGAIHAERLYAILDAVETAGWAPAQPPAAPAESHVDGSHEPGWDRDTIEAVVDAVDPPTSGE